MNRRDCLKTGVGAVTGTLFAQTKSLPLGLPGPYPGKVVGVGHSKCLVNGAYQGGPIQEMLSRGMCELTGADQPADAWRRFFTPDDVVGIKINPVGQPYVCSSPEMLSAIAEALRSAGVKSGNIIVFERYRENLETAGIAKWLPAGVTMAFAAPSVATPQHELEGYDPKHFVDLPGITLPDNPAATRSYAAQFITQRVTKLINLPVLKTHNAAGVTMALKNLSHGLVNNVARSHDGPELRIAEFIPPVIAMPVIRRKTVLTILDATRGLWDGGPAVMTPNAVWEHKTIYLGTDPVAIDRIGVELIDERRALRKFPPLNDTRQYNARRQLVHVHHIDAAAKAGLGIADRSKIDLRRLELA
jgi:uncharacterized protein (DUF362 family)